MVHGSKVFEIIGYSKLRGTGKRCISSGTFSVGGSDTWCIRFYPNGNKKDDYHDAYIAVYLEYTGVFMVQASCVFSLVDRTTRLSTPVLKIEPRIFDSGHLFSTIVPETSKFLKRSELEARYLKNDNLKIECTICIIRDPQIATSEIQNSIKVPPSDIEPNLGKLLLKAEEGRDVTFSVGGETFTAHRAVLALRSPVFRAELFGPMREGSAHEIVVTIEDMHPDVFRALLYFLYTDSLPDFDSQYGKAKSEMIRHLLVAADRYAVDRLKLICQNILCQNLDVENVATTLALSCQHSCDKLKDICLKYLSTSNVMDAVVETQGYKNLKDTCPALVVDVLEEVQRFRKT
ncbi:hypothetical protein PR202_gb25562 [Eleusine coracana subsp. coracana]|uniref:Uncharacterized protein n=1 Tax=Eleusine coracana subsp. coracana TaxID=191504 RepID=A0AAV5FPA5_ELECO|nr:hypothetical protein QOZ80_8BG0650670 [Eleusine coracana subsp. coracana]GJN36679.1 hypothetical protein PR202_gb25562 [Eleusine coracana subsp. coracana]